MLLKLTTGILHHLLHLGAVKVELDGFSQNKNVEINLNF